MCDVCLILSRKSGVNWPDK